MIIALLLSWLVILVMFFCFWGWIQDLEEEKTHLQTRLENESMTEVFGRVAKTITDFTKKFNLPTPASNYEEVRSFDGTMLRRLKRKS